MDIVIIDKIEMMTLVMTSQVMMTVMLLISLTPGPQPIRGLHGDGLTNQRPVSRSGECQLCLLMFHVTTL